MKNFHVLLPEDIYGALRAEAERSRRPVTVLAQQAIESWLRSRKRDTRYDEIALFAAENAGTPLDIDAGLEAAASEILFETDREHR